jgi:hypothetical protein
MSCSIISCYYKIKSKRSHDNYDNYINNLFNSINKNVNFVLFTSKDLEEYFLIKTKLLTNVKVIVKEFDNIELLNNYLNIWESHYKMDLQKNTGRGIECYVLWNSKLNFIKEAIQLNYFNSDKFIWMDIGMIRNNEYIEYLNNFPNYENISNDKIDIILLRNFNNQNQKFFQDEIHFSGASFGGHKNIFDKFISLYYNKFDEYIANNKFIGCDQQIISSVYLENRNLFNPIKPIGKTDPWFYLICFYSIDNKKNINDKNLSLDYLKITDTAKKYITCNLQGRLGNYLFIIISCWAYAKKNNINFVMNNTFKSNKYFNSFFSNINITNTQTIIFNNKKSFNCFENSLVYEYDGKSNLIFNGCHQNSNNFNIYRDDVLKTFFNISKPLESNNNFFIHIRLTDFLISKIHNINLENYYSTAIEYAKTIINFENTNIYVVSDDIKSVKKKSYLKLFPENNLIYIDNKIYDEEKTFELFKSCYLGCICGHSTFAWWGAYIINNPNKLVIIPNKFINTNDDFSGMYLNYKVIPV